MSDPVIVETERRGSGAGWVIGAILLLALIVGAFFFSRMSESQVATNNAVAGAANNVGQAAKDVGAAANHADESAK